MPARPGTVGRVVAILERLADGQKSMRLTEIARSLELPVSSTHVLLRGLTSLGYVELNADERTYRIGPRLIRLSIRIVSRLVVVDVARPLVNNLAMQLSEDVYVGVTEANAISYAYRADGEQSLRLDVQLGVERPLHSTAVGKLYLAAQDDGRLERILKELDLHSFTPHTAVEPDALRKQIEAIRAQGHAISDQEMVEGIVTSAAPILDDQSRMVGAVSVPVLRATFEDRGEALVSALRETAAEISHRLGWDFMGAPTSEFEQSAESLLTPTSLPGRPFRESSSG